jgi:predicted dehydrogenase
MFGRLNMAIIGTGNIAGTMAKTMKCVSSVTSYAVASRDIEKAKTFAKQYGFKKAYGSYEEMLQDRKVDLVYIATPHSEHYANMKMAISYGKPVLCEKSFTVNAKQAEEIFALAEEKNVFVTEAMWVRYMPMYQTIKDVLASKVIGDPVMLTANLGYNIRWVKRMTDPELAGGALLDVGVYTLTFASMMFGEDILKIEPTCTYTETGVDEQDSITLKYRDGRMAVLTASMLGISDRKGIIYGTKGYIIIENINNFETLTVYDNAYQKIGFYKRPKQKTGYEYEVTACVTAIKSGWLEAPAMPHKETISILKMMDEIRSEWGIGYPCEGGTCIHAAAPEMTSEAAAGAAEALPPVPAEAGSQVMEAPAAEADSCPTEEPAAETEPQPAEEETVQPAVETAAKEEPADAITETLPGNETETASDIAQDTETPVEEQK